MQRYFVDKCINELVMPKNSNEFYHLTKVLRAKANETVEVCDLNGDCYLYILESITSSEINLVRQENKLENNELTSELVLAISLLKNNNFELVLQKAVELGVTKIIPLETERTIIKSNRYSKDKFSRFEKIITEAAEQSKRNIVPVIVPVMTLSQIIDQPFKNKYVAYENDKKSHILNEEVTGDTLIIIGPEGGFSSNEVNYLINNGVKPLSLGKRILRAETAAMYALSILSSKLEIEEWSRFEEYK